MSDDKAVDKKARDQARYARYYYSHHQKRLDTAKKYRESNPDKVRESRRLSREKHGDKRRAEYRVWHKANRESCRLKDHARRAAILSGAEDIPRDYVKMLLYIQNYQCEACLCDLRSSGYHIDHIQAVARGGRHEIGNLQILCPHCNLSKGAKNFLDFLDETGRLECALAEAHSARKQERIAKWYRL